MKKAREAADDTKPDRWIDGSFVFVDGGCEMLL